MGSNRYAISNTKYVAHKFRHVRPVCHCSNYWTIRIEQLLVYIIYFLLYYVLYLTHFLIYVGGYMIAAKVCLIFLLSQQLNVCIRLFNDAYVTDRSRL